MGKLDDILSNPAIPKVIIAIYMPFAHLQENRRTKIKMDIFHVLSVLYILARFCISGSSEIFAQVAICSAHLALHPPILTAVVYNWSHWSTHGSAFRIGIHLGGD